MKDTLVKAIAHEGRIRITAVSTTNLVEEAHQKHQTWPTASAALGRTLGMALIMGSDLKNDDEKISINIKGDGPLGEVVVEAKRNGKVRGFVDHPDIYLQNEASKKLDVGKAIGSGTLTVTRHTGLKVDYTSSVALQTGEIGDDFAYYYLMSEQIPSAISLGVLVGKDGSIEAAGALAIEVMPDATEMDIDIIEDVVNHLKPISTIIQEGMDAKELACALFQDVEILEEKEVYFECDCSREQMASTLSLLEIKDLKTFIEEDEGCEMICHYCNTHYFFTQEDIAEIIHQKIQHVN